MDLYKKKENMKNLNLKAINKNIKITFKILFTIIMLNFILSLILSVFIYLLLISNVILETNTILLIFNWFIYSILYSLLILFIFVIVNVIINLKNNIHLLFSKINANIVNVKNNFNSIREWIFKD